MARRNRPGSTSRRERSGRRYASVGREEDGSEHGLSEPGAGRVDESVDLGADEDLSQASMEDLLEFADELEIEDYESLTREELVEEIRRETRPGT